MPAVRASSPVASSGPVRADPPGLDGLAEQGFVVVDLLTAHEVATVSALVPSRVDQPAMAFSDHLLDGAERAELRARLVRSLGAALGRIVSGHRVVSASTVTKAPSPAGAMAWHVDPAITDEARWRSLSAWIPLVDVAGSSGALEVLAGGHLGAPPHRGGSGTLVATHPPHEVVLAACRAAGGIETGPIELRAGQALVYDHRLPHRSGANGTDHARPAINVGLVPHDAPLLLNIWIASGSCERWAVSDEAFGTSPLDEPPSTWPGSRLVDVVRPGIEPTAP